MGYSKFDSMLDRQYLADTVEDLKNIRPIQMGDTCFVIETSELYMVNSKKEWILLKQSVNIGDNPTDAGALWIRLN